MKSFICSCAVALVVVAPVHAQGVVGRTESTYTVRERLSSGERLRVATPNGAVTISESSGSEVIVRVEKTTERGGDIADMGVVVRRMDGGLVVCAVYEDGDECDMDRGYRSSRRNGWDKSRVRARLVVSVPSGITVDASSGNGDLSVTGGIREVRASTGNGRVNIAGTAGPVTARTGNGAVTVEGARGTVDANTGNGDVRVSTSTGPVNVRSGNGDIEVSMDRLEQGSSMAFNTGNGRIRLSVPEGFGAEIDGSTGSGKITTDLPIRLSGSINPRRLRGTLGNGGEPLTIRTGNGDVEIRRSR